MVKHEPPLLKIENVVVRYNGQTVLDQLSFELGRGEFLSILGPNGAGKSTCLKVLDGIIEPSAGRIELRGRPFSSLSRRELAKEISYVPQGDPGGLAFSVQAFVEMGRYPYLGPWQPLGPKDHEAVQEAMRRTEIDHLAERLIGSLSGGERQRTVIAAALAQGGSILLLDEPTSFLDYRHQVQILNLLDRLHCEHAYTIVAVTHDLNSTVAMSDVALALDRGRAVLFGKPEELFDVGRLEKIYKSPFSLIERPDGGAPIVVPERRGDSRGRP